MRRFCALTLLIVVLLLPAWVGAAPQPVTLPEYQATLQRGVDHLESAVRLASTQASAAQIELATAQRLLQGRWQVAAPGGLVEADLTGLATLLEQAGPAQTEPYRNLTLGLALARDHLAAAQELQQAEPTQVSLTNARRTLNRAVGAQSVRERLNQWISRILGLDRLETGFSKTLVNRSFWGVGSMVALAGLAILGFFLYRILRGQAGGREAALGQGRKAQRPPTPQELRQQAADLSAQGHHLDGLRTLHLALLQRFDQVGLIRYQPAQTNREHERQLRRQHPPLARSLRLLNDLVDDRLYAGHEATANDFAQAQGLVDQLWREGDAASHRADATTGASSSAPSP